MMYLQCTEVVYTVEILVLRMSPSVFQGYSTSLFFAFGEKKYSCLINILGPRMGWSIKFVIITVKGKVLLKCIR